MSPCVSTTVTSNRGGTSLLFHFFACLHGPRHFRKFAAAAAAAATFVQFPIDFSFIFFASASQSETGRGKGKRKAKGGMDISVPFFFFTTARARRARKEGGICDSGRREKEILFWFNFQYVFCPSFEIERGEGGSVIP